MERPPARDEHATGTLRLLLPAMASGGLAIGLAAAGRPFQFLAAVALTAVLATLALGVPAPPATPPGPPDRARRSHRPPAAAVATVVLLLVNLHRFDPAGPGNTSAWTIHLAALALLVVIVFLRNPRHASTRHRPGHRELLALVAILAVACLFRFHLLTSMPYGVWYDEAENTMQVQRILDDPGYRPVFVAGRSQMPALPFYVFAPFVAATGPTVLGVRLATTFVGLAAILAVWALGRELFGSAVGLAAAALLAVSRWHVTFSRFGMSHILTTLFIPLVILFFFRALRHSSSRDAVAGGVLLGLGLQAYYSMLAVPPLLAGIFVHSLVTDPTGRMRKAVLAALFLAVSVLAYAPVLSVAVHQPEIFAKRFSSVTVLKRRAGPARYGKPAPTLETLAGSAVKHLAMFHMRGDNNGRHNLPGRPMLEASTGLLMAVGLLWAVAGAWRDTRLFALLLWTAGLLAPGILSVAFEAPQGARTLGVLPAVILLAALPAGRLWKASRGRGPRGYRLAAVLALAAVMVLAAGSSWATYFHRQRYDPAVWAAFSTPQTRIGRTAAAAGPETEVHVPPAWNGGPTEELLAGRSFRAHDLAGPGHLPLPDAGRDVLVFVRGRQEILLEVLRSLYPGARFEPFGPPLPGGSMGPPLLWTVRIPRGSLGEPYGWRLSGPRKPTLRIPSSTWTWPTPPHGGSTTLRVDGGIRVTADGPYRISIESEVAVDLRLDGALVADRARHRDVELMLARGIHRVEIGAVVGRSGLRTMLRWSGPGPDRELRPVPADLLLAPAAAPGGLLGRYYPGEECRGTPAFQRLDPAVSFTFHRLELPRPYCVVWQGSLLAPADGLYRIGTDSIDETLLWVDGTLVLENRSRKYRESTVPLAAGAHALTLLYRSRSGHGRVHLHWAPPGSPRGIVPPAALQPPPPGSGAADVPQPEAAAWKGPSRLEPPRVEVLLGPGPPLRGVTRITAGPDGTLYGLEQNPSRLLSVKLDGAPAVGHPVHLDLAEPTDLAVSPEGTVWILDAGGFLLAVEEGRPGASLDLRAAALYMPRGLALGRDGSFLVADTGHGRIVVFDRSGALLRTLGKPGSGAGEFREPMALAVVDGTVTVVEAVNRRVQRLSPAGGPLGMRPLGVEPWGLRSPRLDGDRRSGLWIAGGSDTVLWWTAPDGDLDLHTAAILGRGVPRDLAVLGPGQLAVLLQDGSLLRVTLPVPSPSSSPAEEHGRVPGRP